MLGEREGGPSAAGPPPDRGEDGAALGARVTRPRKGPALMLLATAMFTAMVACVKVARDEMGPLEVILALGGNIIAVIFLCPGSARVLVHDLPTRGPHL